MPQARPELGTKRICPECGTRFYDLLRVPPTCPKCDAEFVAAVRPPRAARPKPRGKAFAKFPPAQAWTAGDSEHPEAEVRPDDDVDGGLDDADESAAEDEETAD